MVKKSPFRRSSKLPGARAMISEEEVERGALKAEMEKRHIYKAMAAVTALDRVYGRECPTAVPVDNWTRPDLGDSGSHSRGFDGIDI